MEFDLVGEGPAKSISKSAGETKRRIVENSRNSIASNESKHLQKLSEWNGTSHLVIQPKFPPLFLLEQGREPITNSTHVRRRFRNSNPHLNDGTPVLSPLPHPCSFNTYMVRELQIHHSSTRRKQGAKRLAFK